MDKLVGTKFSVKVDEYHIERGIPECSTICAIALAVEEQFASKFEFLPFVSVRNKTFIQFDVHNDRNTFIFHNDKEIVEWTENFDDSDAVEPLEIEFSINDMKETQYETGVNRFYYGNAKVV